MRGASLGCASLTIFGFLIVRRFRMDRTLECLLLLMSSAIQTDRIMTWIRNSAFLFFYFPLGLHGPLGIWNLIYASLLPYLYNILSDFLLFTQCFWKIQSFFFLILFLPLFLSQEKIYRYFYRGKKYFSSWKRNYRGLNKSIRM